MTGKANMETTNPLARNLRVGLLGSPYDWADLDFDTFKKNGVSLSLISFAGTHESNRQDLLLLQSAGNSSKSGIQVIHDEFSLLEVEFNTGLRPLITKDWLLDSFGVAIKKLNEVILGTLLNHQEKYVSTESIIARYGTQVLRVGALLGNPQIHIENAALSYLLETPWRNEHELDFVISMMVFRMEGDVLRKPFVQNMVYDFGTSIRGVSNSNAVRSMIESFSLDVISSTDFRTASRLFGIQLESFSLRKLERKTAKPMAQSRRVA